MRFPIGEVAHARVVASVEIPELPTAPVHDPANHSEVVGDFTLTPPEVIDAVVRSAKDAGVAWGALTYAERASHLAAAATAMEHEPAQRVRAMTLEQGKPLWESQLDVVGAARLLRYYADFAQQLDDEQYIEDERGVTVIRRRPIGPTAIIVPWNYPVYLCLMGMAPALLAGNPVIVKPSELAPLALTAVLRTIAEALPAGVVNVVPGWGAETGAALTSHPDVRKIVFTGGTATGRSVLHAAADRITSVSLELGGNDPAIVLTDAAMDEEMMRELRQSVFTCAGQVCFNVKRIYVARDRYDEFVEAFTKAASEIAVGPGMHPGTTMGPLNNAQQLAFVSSLVDGLAGTDATVTVVGTAVDPDSWDDGYFMLPHIVTNVDPYEALVTCEQFGPVIPIIPFDSEDQVIAWANDTEFGLAASVWSRDIDAALRVGRRIEAGSVFVNSHRVGSSDMSMPFGGMKQSGLGRNHGIWAIDECSELQSLSYRPNTSVFPGPHILPDPSVYLTDDERRALTGADDG